MKLINFARILFKESAHNVYDLKISKAIICERMDIVKQLLDEDNKGYTIDNIICAACSWYCMDVITYLIDKKFYHNMDHYILALSKSIKCRNNEMIKYLIANKPTIDHSYNNTIKPIIYKIVSSCDYDTLKQLFAADIITKKHIENINTSKLENMMCDREFDKILLILNKGEFKTDSEILSYVLTYKYINDDDCFIKFLFKHCMMTTD